MATRSYELTRLDPHTFEHMVNQLAMRELGGGVTGFAPGADAGRDGWFQGASDYPSPKEAWSGTWYIQSKFHAPHVSTDAQKWLRQQVDAEITAFKDSSDREWPDNWIIATNIDPSAYPKTGTHDYVIDAVEEAAMGLGGRTHIWGGEKIIALLVKYRDIADHYGAFVTSGEVLATVFDKINDDKAKVEDIVRDLTATQFSDQQFTKLEQAGSSADSRPGIHKLFIDLPFEFDGSRHESHTLSTLMKASAEIFSPTRRNIIDDNWEKYFLRPIRAQTWFIRGGPGQGKSTVTQYLCQIHRAALIDACPNTIFVTPKAAETIAEIKTEALSQGIWPQSARIPVQIELRQYAYWFGQRTESDKRGVLTYLSYLLSLSIEQDVAPGTLKRAFSAGRWLFVFDGLDEVPGDVKDGLATEITTFCEHTLVQVRSDFLVVCTSRPQGYSGQFDSINPTIINLDQLEPEEALRCAIPVLAIDRNREEQSRYIGILREALESPAIQEIMTTPLQAHIMAVVVRDGGRPPERRWQLFSNFYDIIKKREANTNLPDRRIAKLLREGDELIKSLHNRLGFELHYKAETSLGAQTSIDKDELRNIVTEIVNDLQSSGIDETIEVLMDATTERLVLVNTPENGSSVRFDIRPLQEFFAAEYLYETVPDAGFFERIQIIAGDSHWREVIHFLISALVEQKRRPELAQTIQVLISLDAPEQESARTLAKSLGLGGAISARLLREGVLEADKRVRNQFETPINALLSSIDAHNALPNVGPPHSRDWLAGLIEESLQSKSPAENVGAVILARWLLLSNEDNDLGIDRYIIKQTVEYRTIFLESIALPYEDRSNIKPIPIWVLKYVICQLSSEDWYQLPQPALTNAYKLLGIDVIRSVMVASDLGFEVSVVEKLMTAFVESSSLESLGQDEFLFGVITKSRNSGEQNLISDGWLPEFCESAITLPGLFGLLAQLSLASSTRDDKYFDKLLTSIGGDVAVLDLIPNLPADMFVDTHGDGSECSDDIYTKVRSADAGTRLVHVIHNAGLGPPDWLNLCAKYPNFIPVHVVRGYHGINHSALKSWLQHDESCERVATAYLAHKSPYIPFLGEIEKVSGKYPIIADAMKKATLRQGVDHRWRPVYGEPLAYNLTLPDEVYLLPIHLQQTMMQFERNGLLDRNIRLRSQKSLESFICETVEDKLASVKIAMDSGYPGDIRISAAIVCLADEIRNDGDISFSISIMREVLTDKNVSFSYRIILSLLTKGLRDNNTIAISFIDDVLSLTRNDLLTRLALAPVIATWREITRSPVTSSLNRNIWK